MASPAPLVRREGRIAKDAHLRARYEVARVLGDAGEQRAAARPVAERLASRDVELDVAVELALKTLAEADDPELRRELAGWLEGLGEPALAASELRRLVDGKDPRGAAALLVRIGVLHARAGDAQGAEEALASAARIDEASALALELAGAVAGWAPDVVTPRAAADAYVAAAKRRAAAGEDELELEDLLRAFELDPASPVAAAALALAHTRRAHASAADEVLRAHAQALAATNGAADAAEVHARRRAAALGAGDLSHALAAALDEGLDAAFDGPGADAMDDLLARANAFEPLAARLAVRAERAAGRDAARRWAELGRLLAGPLSATERALEAYARSVALDATNHDALHALTTLADSADSRTWLVEGLVRAVLGDDVESRLAASRALAAIDRPELAPLAARVQILVAKLDPSDERAAHAASAAADEVRRHEEEIALARAAVSASADGARLQALSDLARLLRCAPAASSELLGVLTELSRVGRDADAILHEAIRVADRVGDLDALVALCRARLVGASPPPRVRIALVAALGRKGDARGAADEARALFDAVTPAAYSIAWIAAAAAGDEATRARALAALGPICSPKVVSVMASTAAEALAREGDLAAARRAAEQACRTDPQDARALRVLAELVSPSEGRVAITALERAVGVAGPGSALSARLADAYEQSGDVGKALAWARRVVALRPADRAAIAALVARATRGGDVESLADALGWLVPQPWPGRALADALLPALRALSEKDPKRASQVCARALDLLGPRHAPLREAALEIARAAGDARLVARITERWLAAGAPAAERGPLLSSLASTYARLEDTELELLAYARAARAGEDLTPVRERVASIDASALSPDAELALLEVRAELCLDEGRTDVAFSAFRDFGAALWDCADDRPRAVQAWLRAAQLDSVNGYATLRRDLSAVADAEYATDCLAELAMREEDSVRAGIIATEAARAAMEAQAFPRALSLARTALERDPKRTAALETAEGACVHVGRVQEMSPIYDQIARRALGRFGRRAAHHRAARFFESSGVHMMALKHAAQAFIAVPSEGSTLGLLARTADRAQRRSVAVRTIEHVAELARSPGQRAAWLLRAASMAGKDLEGARQRVDVLLKAAVLSASPTTLAMLGSAARELLGESPDDAVALATRLERASESLARSLEGPDGARIAIAFAELALDLFRDAGWAWRAIEQATGADGDIEEYGRLIRHAGALAAAEGAEGGLARLVAGVEKPYANIGHSLLRLVGAIAGALGDAPRRARALVMAAEREPDDDRIVAEAEDALAQHPDEALAARLAKKVDADRRIDALRAIAKKIADEGDAPTSVRFLERAWIIAPVVAKQAISRELKDALLKAGREEEALARDLEDPELPTEQRAERWAEIAKVRRGKDDKNGVTEALYAAAQADPTAARWAALEEAADRSRHEDVRVEALRALAQLVEGADRMAVMKRLARAEGARGALDVAESVWRGIWQADPSDGEADVAIEALLVARSAHADLADHLAKRAARLAKDPASSETLRAVRLRRAALLEQRLGRLEDAAKELEQLLVEVPGHASALRWLAELHERMGHAERALPALEEITQRTQDDAQHQSVEIRRARALVASGDVERAREAVKALADRGASSLDLSEARVEVARAAGDARELGDALEALAKASPEDARVRSEMLVEASQCAARAGDTDASLARARAAAELAPDVAATQLFARGLEYRLRGPGSPEDAAATIASLSRLSTSALEPEDVALRAFLLAEAEDVASPGKGEETLRECHALFGSQPLVALGLAERAAAAGRAEEALEEYDDAIAGNLLGLLRAGLVALAAADAAESCGQTEAQLRFLGDAARDDEARAEAAERIEQVALTSAEVKGFRAVLRYAADGLEGAARATLVARVGRALFDSDEPAERLEADRTLREAIKLAPEELGAELQAELEGFRARVPVPASPSMQPGARVSVPPPLPRKLAEPQVSLKEEEPVASVMHPPMPAAPVRSAPPPPVPAAGSPAPTPPTPPPPLAATSIVPRPLDYIEARLDAARQKLAAGESEAGERLLAEALRAGSVKAADMLDELVARDPARSALLTKIRRQAAELLPGDMKRLVALRDAAKADQNANYTRAIEHVLRAFDTSAGPLAPPPLSAQSAQPGMLALLTRHSREPGGEAFGILWEGAQPIFVKPPTAYGTTGLERVVPGPATPLSRLYEVALRLLDIQRFALFHRRGNGLLAASIALLPTPSAILSGYAETDTSDMRLVVGEALAAVVPQNLLPLAMMETEGRSVWSVLVGAFGPPGRGKLGREHAALAEMLWQRLAPSAQRRLKELLASGDDTPYDLVVERARQSGRRIGLFLTGDFGHTARHVIHHARHVDASALDQADLHRFCREIPALADLFRLAIRPEYADARWHVSAAPPTSQRFSSSRISIV